MGPKLDGMRVDHLAIVVPDLETAMAFYRDVMHCDVTPPMERHGQGLRKAFVVMANVQLELIEPTAEESPIKHLLEEHNVSDFLRLNPQGGLHHVCYDVPDLTTAVDALLTRGHRMLGTSGPVTGASGQPVLFVDPSRTGGVLIELKQADPRSAS